MALNLYVIRVQKDDAGDFFRSVQKQCPLQYQGLYLVAPDGRVLASHQAFKSQKTWAQEVLADLKPGLKAFGEIRPRQFKRINPLPDRGLGIQPDGGVTLAIYLRVILKGVPPNQLPNPTMDSLRLTAAQLAELVPPKDATRAQWAIPESLAREFSRVLGPGNENTMPRPREVESVRLIGEFQAVKDGIGYAAYHGSITGAHLTAAKNLTHGEASLAGVVSYDVKTRQMRSLVWVFDGVYRAAPPYDAPKKYGAVVEWKRERAAR